MKTRILLLVLVVFSGLLFPAADVNAQPKVAASLTEIIGERSAEDFISVNIRLAAQYEGLHADIAQGRSWVISQLKSFSREHQGSLLDYLQQQASLGNVRDIRPHWIGNFIHCQVKPEVIVQLSTRKDLARLSYNHEYNLLIEDPAQRNAVDNKSNIAWNVSLINAPQVWQMGFQGQGVVVGILDTGVNYNHKDLEGQMWEDPGFPFHGYNFAGNNFSTMDFNGHGTHTAGTVAGTGEAGTRTGVAPHAKIMSIKVLDNYGVGSEASVWAGIEFGVEHGADILNMSLGYKHAWNPDRVLWRQIMDNVKAAGVIAAVAAGNEGNGWEGDFPPNQVRTPGDVPAPWLHPDQIDGGGTSGVVSVGSTTNSDNISAFSSKGPVTWDFQPFMDYALNPGIGLIRPDLVAPGSNITSLAHNNNSGYANLSGTSMATPAVAGVMALMLSKNPQLTPAQISQILEQSAQSLSPAKSNISGSGRLNALEAVMQSPELLVGYMSHQIVDAQGNNDGKINPGEDISLNVILKNRSLNLFDNLQARISTNSAFIELADTLVEVGLLNPGQIKDFHALISFRVSDIIPGNHRIEFLLEIFQADNAGETWISYFSETAFAPGLQVSYLVIDDSQTGNNNGQPDPGETVLLRLKLHNTGQLSTDPITVTFSDFPVFIMHSVGLMFQPGVLEPGQQVVINLPITIHQDILPGTLFNFTVTVSSGAYLLEELYQLKTGHVTETWESGDFNAFNWQHPGDTQWQITTSNVFEGIYAAKSGSSSHSELSHLSVQYDVFSADSIAFFFSVSSETGMGWLEFYVDMELTGRWSGEIDWQRASYKVEEGIRTFCWIYKKEGTGEHHEDAAWIDMIEFPASIFTNAFAGFDTAICSDSIPELEGFALVFQQLEWFTNGDGSFSDPHNISTYYFPGVIDKQSGQVELSLQVQNQQEPPVSHSMTLQLLPLPVVDLGGEIILCRQQTIELNAGHASSYLWHDGSTEAFFIVDPANYSENTLTVWVLAINESGCAATDTLIVIFDECLGATTPAIEPFLKVYPNPATHMVTLDFETSSVCLIKISITDITGQVIRTFSIDTSENKKQFEISLQNIPAGIYLLNVYDREVSMTRKLIIQ
jgi:subtilisin family serine protease